LAQSITRLALKWRSNGRSLTWAFSRPPPPALDYRQLCVDVILGKMLSSLVSTLACARRCECGEAQRCVERMGHDGVCAHVRVRSRTQVQMGIPVIPKSSNPEHLAQNIDLFSWTLSDEDMAGHCPTPICVGRDVLRLCALGDCALCLTHVARAGLPPSETQYTVLDSSGLSFFDCGSAVFRVQTCRLRRRSRPGWPPHFGRL